MDLERCIEGCSEAGSILSVEIRVQLMFYHLRLIFFNGDLAIMTSSIKLRDISPVICACASGVCLVARLPPIHREPVVQAMGTPSSDEKCFE